MWERLREWVRAWLGIGAESVDAPVDAFSERYEDISKENITAQIAHRLAMLTFSDSTFEVRATTPRGRLIKQALESFWALDAPRLTAQVFGKGGLALAPIVTKGGAIEIAAVEQNRTVVLEEDAGRLLGCAVILADERVRGQLCHLIACYQLEQGAHSIRYRAVTEGGAPLSLKSVPAWSELPQEIRIGQVEGLMLTLLACPADPRRTRAKLGVPITYGAEPLLEELCEHLRVYRREFRLTRPMLGLDSSLWRGDVHDIRQVRKTVQDGDDPFIPFDSAAISEKGVWQYYAPAIRWEAMEARCRSLCARIERACGLSQGILTERQALRYANRDEVRAAQYDTFSVIRAMRFRWEQALQELARAVDVLAEYYGLTPAGGRGGWELRFDWDTSLIESTSETFQQYLELEKRGAITKEELKAWVMGTLKD